MISFISLSQRMPTILHLQVFNPNLPMEWSDMSVMATKCAGSSAAAPAVALASASFLFSRHTFCKHTRLPHLTVQQGRKGRVVCMAHPRRVKMVAQQIKREIGDMLIKDKVLQHAILPETALGADMYLSSLATVSDVVLSNDLQVAKVYVSIFSDERGKEIVMEGLKAKTKHVRAGLGKRMQLRLTPEIRFIMDDSLERGSRVIAILDRLQKEREDREAGNDGMDANDDGDNWDDIVEEDAKPLGTGQHTVDEDRMDYDDEKIMFVK